MTHRTTLTAATLLAATLACGSAHAALQGRDLNGSAGSFEAYYDTVLDITWLADANYAKTSGYDADGLMTWSQATAWAANLSFYNPLTNQTYADWRLPTAMPVNGVNFVAAIGYDGSKDLGYNITRTTSELAYMYYVNLGNLAGTSSSSGCFITSNLCLDNVGPFSNLLVTPVSGSTSLYANYWYGQEMGSGYPASFSIVNGFQGYNPESEHHYAWAVSSGDIAAVPEADTWAMLLAGLGLVGAAARRRG